MQTQVISDCYSDAVVARHYEQQTTLFPAEAIILERVRSRFVSPRILDVGVGAGRTVADFSKFASSYVGIDCSQVMIEAAQKAFPLADLRIGDMRDVGKSFSPGSFDFILVSFNCLDHVGFEDREKVLSTLHSLLSKDGMLAFSSHQLLPERISFRRRVGNVLRFKKYRSHPLKNLEAQGDGFRVRTEWHFNQPLLIYYTTPAVQIKQLKAFGFQGECEFFHPYTPESADFSGVSWLYYLVSKKA
jgi:predicted TPR repeat methyltransferase